MATDEDLLEAEWESVADGSSDMNLAPNSDAASSSEPVLNQDEIDSLLGLDENDDEGVVTGIQAIVESAMVSYERLPMLEIVFDRLLRMMSTSLRNLTSDNVEVSLDSITSIRFEDYLATIPMPAMLSVFKAEEWDNYGLMVVDSG
ncbi:MAG: flagellar motor switch protein FliM, partial [Pseudomonadota bacterium]|nr:flagellar motor switch protein FliM [Pseudomonadota bacterium]